MTEDLQQTGEIGAAETVAAEAPTAEAPAAEVQAETAAAGEAPAAAEEPAAKAVANSKKTRAAETKTEAPAEPEPEAAAGQETAAAEPAAAAVEPQPVRNENFRWYILHAYSGFERKVRESIESRVQAFGLKERVGRVMIPTEPVTEIVNGKKRTVERVFLPGYVLVEMELDNELWHVLKDTPKVTGFLGTGDKPVALSEEEVSSILFRSETSKDKPRMKIKFEKSEQVRITDGPFANFNGVVDEVNEDRETLKVMVTIFGRSTPVELEFGKVEKIE
jgi:transcription termination/antitermination protein NusG